MKHAPLPEVAEPRLTLRVETLGKHGGDSTLAKIFSLPVIRPGVQSRKPKTKELLLKICDLHLSVRLETQNYLGTRSRSSRLMVERSQFRKASSSSG